jgi:hypothetical protein
MPAKQGQIIFDSGDWLAGLNQQFGYYTTAVVGGGISDVNNFMPLRPNGVAGPGWDSSAITGSSVIASTEEFLRNGVVNGAGGNKEFYMISNGNGSSGTAKIHEFDVTAGITNGGAFPHTIGSSTNGYDIVTYYIGSTPYAFYSYSTGTTWNVGRYDFASTFADTFMSVTPATPLAAPYLAGGAGYTHPMMVGDDDTLLIGDRNYVHSLDGQTGANGTFEVARLILPTGFVVEDFAKTDTFAVVFATRQNSGDRTFLTDSRAYFWNYLDLDPTYIVDLEDNFVSAAFNYKGTIGCFTYGRVSDLGILNSNDGKLTKLKLFNAQTMAFETVGVFDGEPPIPGGIEIMGDYLLWNSGALVYSFDGQYINQIAGTGLGSESGLLRNVNPTNLVTSTSNNMLKFSTGYSNGNLKTKVKQPVFSQGKCGRMKSVEVEFYSLGTSNSKAFTLNLFGLGMNDTTIISSTTPFSSSKLKFESDTSGNPLPEFEAVGSQLAWGVGPGTDTGTPPKVKKVIVNYEEKNIDNV